MKKITFKIGDEATFTAISWNEGWEFDYPSLLISPYIDYASDGRSPDQLIEDALVDIVSGVKITDYSTSVSLKKEFKWRGWNIDTIKRAAGSLLNGNLNVWKTKRREVLKVKVRFIEKVEFGEKIMWWEELERKEYPKATKK